MGGQSFPILKPLEIWPIYNYNYWPLWHCSFVKTWYLIISIMLPGKGKHKTASCTTPLTLSIIQIQIQIYWQGESRTMQCLVVTAIYSAAIYLYSLLYSLQPTSPNNSFLLSTFSSVCLWKVCLLLITYCLFYFSTFNDYIKNYNDNWT